MTQISILRSIVDKHATIGFGMGELTDYQQPFDFRVEPIYSPDAVIALTPFSEEIFQLLCGTANRLAGPRFRSANVSWSNSDEDAEYRLDLVIRVDAGWDDIESWEYAIEDEITRWSEKWTDSQWDDYSWHIFHSLVPLVL